MGDTVYVRKFPPNDDWIPGTIMKNTGPLSFVIKLETGQTVCRHVDHVRHQTDVSNPEPITDWTDLPDIVTTPQTEHNTQPTQIEMPMLRRSTRVSVPPQRYSPSDVHS